MSKHGITLDLVETGGIQQLHEGGDNRGKWRRMPHERPFRILMRVSKIEISIISKIEEKAKKKESFSQNFFHPWKTTLGNWIPQIVPPSSPSRFLSSEIERERESEKRNVASINSRAICRIFSSLCFFTFTNASTANYRVYGNVAILPLLFLTSRYINVDIHWRNVYVTSRTNKRANKRNEFEIEFTEFQILLR